MSTMRVVGYALSNGPKELFVVGGATHIALYDMPEYVDQAVAKLASFFGAHLSINITA